MTPHAGAMLAVTMSVTIDEIIAHKRITDVNIAADLEALRKAPTAENKRCFHGNKTLYHYQMANLCDVSINGKPSLREVMDDAQLYAALYNKMLRLNRTGSLPNRLFEAQRFNNAVVFFKPTTAKYIYAKLGATKVLDPTAGWGGRMLGAWALGIEYTGFDTNLNLRDPYTQMMSKLDRPNLRMIFEDSLAHDFSTIDYDCVLTSPPYINTEIYPHMTPFQSASHYYTTFLIPLLNKCLLHIRPGGTVCFNISPKMYDALLKHGFRAADFTIDLLQQKRLGTNKNDQVYCWKQVTG